MNPPVAPFLALAGLSALALLVRELGAILLGRILPDSVPPTDRRFRVLLEVVAGLGIVLVLLFLTGLMGLFRWSWVLALPLLPGFLSRVGRSVWRVWDRALTPWRIRPASLGVGLLFAAGMAIPLLLCGIPETRFDALRSHLWAARVMAETGQVLTSSHDITVFYPNLSIPLYAAAYAVFGETGARVAHCSLGILAAALLWAWRRNSQERKSWSWVPSALFLLSPMVLWEMTTAYVDLALGLFSLLFVSALSEWIRTREKGWFWLASLGLGLSMASKYHGFFLLPVAAGTAFFCSPKGAVRWALRLRNALSICLGGLVVVAPWLIRNWVVTGNPLFPVPIPGFSSPLITQGIIEADRAQQAAFGLGHGVMSALSLPWNLLFRAEAFRGTFSGLAFAGAFVVLVFWSRFRLADRLVAVTFLAFVCGWFLTGQEGRYLVPVAALGTWLVFCPLCPVRRFHWAFPWTWCAVLLLEALLLSPPVHSVLYPQGGFSRSRPVRILQEAFWKDRSPTATPYSLRPSREEWDVALGRMDRETFLSSDPFYPVYRWANSHLTGPVRILCYDPAAFWSRNPVAYLWSVDAEFTIRDHDAARLLGRCRELGLTHVVVNMDQVTPDLDRRTLCEFFKEEFQRRYLKEEFRSRNVFLFAIPHRTGTDGLCGESAP